MLKSFNTAGFEFNFVLGEYFLSKDGSQSSGLAGDMVTRLATMIAGEPSGVRRQAMVEALSSIVPEGESVTVQSGGQEIVMTSPTAVMQDVNLGLITSQSEKVSTTFKIVGLRVLNVVKEAQRDYNDCYPIEEQIYELLLQTGQTNGSHKAVLALGTNHGMCGSGYTSASWSTQDLREVSDLGPMTHKPVRNFTVEIVRGAELRDTFGDRYGSHDNQVLCWTGDGGCGYYPSGSGFVNDKKFFIPSGRGHDKPLIHVFMGASNLGKSTLGAHLSGPNVYETDQDFHFSDEMAYAQVIILGNKWKTPAHDGPGQSFAKVQEFFVKKELDVELVPVQFGEACVKEEVKSSPNGNGGTLCWCGCGEIQ